MTKWTIKKTKADIALMSRTLKISDTTAQIMVNRGIRTKKSAIRFLNPELKYFDRSEMKDIRTATALIKEAVACGRKIAIYGDYDVDGVSSTVILFKALKYLGAEVQYYIPHREEEGYGLNINAVHKLCEDDIELLVCCDNGISALDEIAKAKELGLIVVIIDHHEPGFVEDSETGEKHDVLPVADAIVNPKQQSCPYPFKAMCAGGIAYRFACELFADEKIKLHDELLVFAMLATFCDIVDLQEENRIIAKTGLDALNENKRINLGLWHLLKKRGYEEKKIDEFSIGFVIGPSINATGRLERANIAIELFLTEDDSEADKLADLLIELNTKRKELTAASVENSLKPIKEAEYIDKVLVVYNPDIHESIAGIVAGRIKECMYRPTIVLTKSGDLIKGSARSIEAYNIFEELFKCKELFVRFGGLAMAAGLSLKGENLEKLRKTLNDNCHLEESDFVEIIKIDKELPIEQATFELTHELQMLAPFGKGNKEPVFGVKNLAPESIRVIEEKNTIIFTFVSENTYRRIKGICFGMVDMFRESLLKCYDEYETEKIMQGILRGSNLKLDIVYAPDINEYNGNVSVQLRIRDFRISSTEM